MYPDRLLQALKPATEGGLHIRVNFTGCETKESFMKAIVEAGNDLEIQKDIALREAQAYGY